MKIKTACLALLFAGSVHAGYLHPRVEPHITEQSVDLYKQNDPKRIVFPQTPTGEPDYAKMEEDIKQRQKTVAPTCTPAPTSDYEFSSTEWAFLIFGILGFVFIGFCISLSLYQKKK